MKKYSHFFVKYLSAQKHIIVSIFLLFALLLCFLPNKKQVGIVDVAKVYQNAQVFLEIHEQQVAFENKWKEDALAQKERLEQEDKALSKKKAKLKKSKFEKEAKALQERILDFQNQQMAKLDLIRYQIGQLQEQVSETMKPLIEKVAVDKDLVLVLSSLDVLYHNNVVDITEDVIKSLDKAYKAGDLPDLQISLEEGV